jgi:hypothetical protein
MGKGGVNAYARRDIQESSVTRLTALQAQMVRCAVDEASQSGIRMATVFASATNSIFRKTAVRRTVQWIRTQENYATKRNKDLLRNTRMRTVKQNADASVQRVGLESIVTNHCVRCAQSLRVGPARCATAMLEADRRCA